MKMGFCILIRENKNLSVCANSNVGIVFKIRSGMHRLIHDSATRSVCTIGCTIQDKEISKVPNTIGKSPRNLPWNPYENFPRGDHYEFRSEAAHSDRGGSSQGHCAECGGLIVLRLGDPVAYAYETQCECGSNPHNSDLAIVNADNCELSPCNRNSNICSSFEGYLELIPGKTLVKCSRVT